MNLTEHEFRTGRKLGPVMPHDVAETQPVLDVYVPAGEDTAVLLTGTADEYGIPQSHIVPASQGGYWISEALADIVYEDEDALPDTPDAPATGSTTA